MLFFATHSHEDRAGDLSFYNKKGIRTYATSKTNEILRKEGRSTSKEIIKIGKTYNIGGEEFIVDFLGEGHTVDNVVVWFPKYKILDGGCLVKSKAATDLGFTGEANLRQWPQTMKKLQSKYPDAEMIIPGHDEWKGGGHVEHTLDLLNKKTGLAAVKSLIVPSRKVGNLVYLSGSGSALKGTVGRDVTAEQAFQAAEDIAKKHLEEMKRQASSLNNVRIVKVNGFVKSEAGFGNQSSVLNAYSEYLISILGKENGEHARTTIGVADLPNNSSVEIDVIFEII